MKPDLMAFIWPYSKKTNDQETIMNLDHLSNWAYFLLVVSEKIGCSKTNRKKQNTYLTITRLEAFPEPSVMLKK